MNFGKKTNTKYQKPDIAYCYCCICKNVCMYLVLNLFYFFFHFKIDMRYSVCCVCLFVHLYVEVYTYYNINLKNLVFFLNLGQYNQC